MKMIKNSFMSAILVITNDDETMFIPDSVIAYVRNDKDELFDTISCHLADNTASFSVPDIISNNIGSYTIDWEIRKDSDVSHTKSNLEVLDI